MSSSVVFGASSAAHQSRCSLGGFRFVVDGSRKRLLTSRSQQVAAAIQRVGGLALPVEIDDEDLIQFKDRPRWYEAKFAAADRPEWNQAKFVNSVQLTPSLRLIVIEVEISREKIALCNSYKYIGQRAQLRVGDTEHTLQVASSPFCQYLNRLPLFNVRGDLFAGEIKVVKEDASVKAPLEMLVSEEEAPEVYNLEEGTPFEVGPFVGEGMDFKGPIAGVYRYPTIVIFCEGRGIATAKSIIECSHDISSLYIQMREDVRIYYKAQNEDSFLFTGQFEKWEQIGCKVITTTDSFQDAFDDDDTLVYEPAETAAVILTDGDEEAEKKALAVCKEAEITEIVRDSVSQVPTIFLQTGRKQI